MPLRPKLPRKMSIFRNKSERLYALEHFVERVVELAMLGDAATKHRFQISEIADVDHLINAVHERAHCVVRSETVADQHDEMGTALRVRSSRQLGEDRVCLQR